MRVRLVFVLACWIAAAPAHALYDPKPDASLATAQGEWVGSLTYRDDQGPDKRPRLPTRLFVAAHDYRSGAVTIDTSDWYDRVRYRAWLAAHAGADPAPFRRAYLAHLAGRVAYYDGLSRQVLHRSVKHVMLLHTNAINAAFLPDVIEMLRGAGWTLVRPGDAFADPVYAVRPTTLPAGESVLWSLAKQAGLPDLRYPAEDKVYEKPILDALGL